MRRGVVFLMAALGFACAALASASAEPIRNIRVHFQAGSNGTTMHGHLEGRELLDYRLKLQAGQMFRVDMSTASDFAYFNVYEPGKKPGEDAAFYIGSTGGNTVEFRTAHTGDYLVRVYLIPAAARRGQGANFTLYVTVGAGAVQAPPPRRAAPEAKGPGAAFSATGMIPCARGRGQPMASCRFGVHREGNGNGAIMIEWPGGGSRTVFFEDNTPMGFDVSQADGDVRMVVGSEADLYHVRIGNERFEIPAAIMTGG